jgi:uncharacterized membrane protein
VKVIVLLLAFANFPFSSPLRRIVNYLLLSIIKQINLRLTLRRENEKWKQNNATASQLMKAQSKKTRKTVTFIACALLLAISQMCVCLWRHFGGIISETPSTRLLVTHIACVEFINICCLLLPFIAHVVLS